MQSIIDFFLGLGAWNWFILAVVMLLLETAVPGVHFMWFGMAAVVLGALVLLLPIPFAVQLVIFALVSLLMILIARRYWSPQSIKTDAPDLNERAHQYIGRTVTVADAIARGRGKVRVGDTVWSAEGPDAPAGAEVKVTGVKGTVLVVASA